MKGDSGVQGKMTVNPARNERWFWQGRTPQRRAKSLDPACPSYSSLPASSLDVPSGVEYSSPLLRLGFPSSRTAAYDLHLSFRTCGKELPYFVQRWSLTVPCCPQSTIPHDQPPTYPPPTPTHPAPTQNQKPQPPGQTLAVPAALGHPPASRTRLPARNRTASPKTGSLGSGTRQPGRHL